MMAKITWVQIVRRMQLLFALVTLPLAAYTIHYYSVDPVTPGGLYSVVITGASFAVTASFWSSLAAFKIGFHFFDISCMIQWLVSFILILVGIIKINANGSAFCFREGYYCNDGSGHAVGLTTLALSALNCLLFVTTSIADRSPSCGACGGAGSAPDAAVNTNVDSKLEFDGDSSAA